MMADAKTHPADVIRAPWTDEQVAALNAFQRDRRFHPFTCPGERERGERCKERNLTATRDGWVCACGA
jgi:hypothetical protein